MDMSKTLVSHLAKATMPVSDWGSERIPKVKHSYSLGCSDSLLAIGLGTLTT